MGSHLHMKQLNPLKTLKDPAHRWARSGLLHLIGDRSAGSQPGVNGGGTRVDWKFARTQGVAFVSEPVNDFA